MQSSVRIWMPIDKEIHDSDIPRFESVKDEFLKMLFAEETPAEKEDREKKEQEEEKKNAFGGFGGERRGRRRGNDGEDPIKEKRFNDFHKGWKEYMSFSHSVIHDTYGGMTPTVDRFTATKFSDGESPITNALVLDGQVVRCAIIRFFRSTKTTIFINEVEMQYVTIENQSISGGEGGNPVETISFGAKLYKNKIIEVDAVTGNYTCLSYFDWDNTTGQGSRSLLDTPEKTLSKLQGTEKSPDSSDGEAFLGVEPNQDEKEKIFLIVTVPKYDFKKKLVYKGNVTIQGLKDAIATKLGRESKDIEALYSGTIIVDDDSLLSGRTLDNLTVLTVKWVGEELFQ